MTNLQEIERLEEKLEKLRKDYLVASPGMKAYISIGGKMLKQRLDFLKKKLEDENNNQLHI